MIEYTNNGKTTVISEVDPEHQCKLLELIGLSLKQPKSVQYDFTEALEAFTNVAPSDKRGEIKAWITVMESILNGKTYKENRKAQVRNICGL